MVHLKFNGSPLRVSSVEELDAALARINQVSRFELWASMPEGPALAMLRNADNAWLMYLRHEGDSGFSSRGDSRRSGTAQYHLANGQVDEYPLAWCIDLEQCYKAVVFFVASNGGRAEWIHWHDDSAKAQADEAL